MIRRAICIGVGAAVGLAGAAATACGVRWRRYSCALDDVAGYLGLGRQSEHSIYSHDGSLTAAARWAETMAA